MNEQQARDYLGGSGLGIRLAYDEIPPDTDPLSPRNKLYFLTGPVTGTILGTAGRYQVVYKAPLTGLLCDYSSGGYWGAGSRQAGYDALVVEGAAEQLVYLDIQEDKVTIRDASAHWGKDTFTIQEDIRREIRDPKAYLAVIVPLGNQRYPGGELSLGLQRRGLHAGRGMQDFRADGEKACRLPPLYDRLCAMGAHRGRPLPDGRPGAGV